MRLIISLLIVILLVTYLGTFIARYVRNISRKAANRINKAYTTQTKDNGKEEIE